MRKIKFQAAVAMMFVACGGPAWAETSSAYTCGEYLRELGEDKKSDAFLQAVGFTYGAYYMANWSGSFLADEEKLSRFDGSIVANCRMATGDSFFMVAIKTANDYSSR